MVYHQSFKSVKLSNAWPNTFCSKCMEPVADEPVWRSEPIMWTEVLEIAIGLCGLPTGFYNRDFLIVVEFESVKLIFCGQGPRRGEVEISVPVEIKHGDVLLRKFLGRIRERVEGETRNRGMKENAEGVDEEEGCPECGADIVDPGWCYGDRDWR